MRDDVLFWQYDWTAVVEGQKRAARDAASKLTSNAFAEKSIEELAGELCEKYSLEVPALDTENITVKQREVEIDVSNNRMRHFSSGGPQYVKGTAIDVRIPFTGDAQMFKIKPNTWTTSIPRGRVEGNSVVFTISGTNLEQEKVKAEIDRQISEIQTWLGFQQKSKGNFAAELSQIAQQAVEARKTKIEADADLVSGLGYKTE
ncbi:hypothetical protein FIU86_10115 [Roseovarius sp. THAF9]|uniref:hypothetical protein n=1 Tax=Roseovarius sp. THAF9 TaxID=2587847 RepID=UPI001267891E|nr:hypothetical protein [Roseovarius sp. THAF9]QFT93199.1 hypothetical protein FIU86_10115 [Roseovarius sp. THAF9]